MSDVLPPNTPWLLGRALLLVALMMPAAVAAQDLRHDGWLVLSPYLWMSNIDGTGEIGNVTVPVLDSVLEAELEVRLEIGVDKVRGLFTYSRSSQSGPVAPLIDSLPTGVTTRHEFTRWTGEFFAAVQVGPSRESDAAELFAGMRYTHMEQTAETNGDFSRVEHTEDWVEPVIGARIFRALGSRLWATIMADLGGFDVGSDFTWTVDAEFGIHVASPLDLTTRYVYTETNYDNGDVYRWDGTSQGWFFGLVVSPWQRE